MKFEQDELMPISVRSAYEVIDLWEQNIELRRLAAEGAEWRQKYMDLLNESVARGQTDCANLVRLMLNGNLIPVLAAPDSEGEK